MGIGDLTLRRDTFGVHRVGGTSRREQSLTAHGKAATTIEATDQNGGKIEIVIRV